MRSVLRVCCVSIVVIWIAVCYGCKEVKKRQFENLDAARKEQMIEKGWAPAFIAKDAKNINILSDLDNASVYGSYISSDTVALHKHCFNAEDMMRVPVHGPEWFRIDLNQTDTAEQLRHKGYEVLRCDEGFNVVIFSPRDYIYYWSERK